MEKHKISKKKQAADGTVYYQCSKKNCIYKGKKLKGEDIIVVVDHILKVGPGDGIENVLK
jgi:hypothetical protein